MKRVAARDVVFLFVMGSAIPVRAGGTCSFDWVLRGSQPGFDRFPWTALTWDPDGDGPQVARLVVAGLLTSVGGQAVSGVAAFDGSAWSALGSVNQNGITRLWVHENELYLVGPLGLPGVGTASVVRWDGSVWETLPGLVLLSSDVWPAVASYGGQLLVGGRLIINGAQQAVAAWDGTSWNAVGERTFYETLDMAVYRGELICVGTSLSTGLFPGKSILAWNGNAWRDFATDVLPEVTTSWVVESAGDELVVMGTFESIDGVPMDRIGRYDSKQWHPMGPGLGPVTHTRYATAFHDGQFYLAGEFHNFAGIPEADKLIRWDGHQWNPAVPGLLYAVWSIAAFGNRLYFGGEFDDINGLPAWHGAFLDDNGVQPVTVGFDAAVRALYSDGERLIAAGDFDFSAQHDLGLAYHTDKGWATFPPADAASNDQVFTVMRYQGDLFIGGNFFSIDGRQCRGISRWDGSVWQPVGPIGQATGTVTSMLEFNGDLYANNAVAQPGGPSHPSLSRWDGANWHPLEGLASGGAVALISDGERLYAAGSLTLAGAASAVRAAAWDGVYWEPFAGVFDRSVNSLAVVDDEIFLGGDFNLVDGVAVRGLVRWDGTQWVPPTPNFSVATDVARLAVYNGELFAAGDHSGNAFLARRDDSAWVDVSVGLSPNDEIYALTIHDNKLLIGGRHRPNWTLQTNGFVHAYYLAGGEETDCNLNGVFDVCDIADGHSFDANQNSTPDECEPVDFVGDTNCDAFIGTSDIGPFVLALTDPAAYFRLVPRCSIFTADINRDNTVTVADIGPFVQLLLSR